MKWDCKNMSVGKMTKQNNNPNKDLDNQQVLVDWRLENKVTHKLNKLTGNHAPANFKEAATAKELIDLIAQHYAGKVERLYQGYGLDGKRLVDLDEVLEILNRRD